MSPLSMSSDSNTDLIGTYEAFILANRANFAAAALVVYEHLVTLRFEKELLWRRNWSAATWIFVFNRYLLLADVLFLIVPFGSQVCENTAAMNALSFLVLGIAPELPLHAFTVLRCFALLQNRSWRLAVTWILIALSLSGPISNAYTGLTQTWGYQNDPVLGSICFQVGYSVTSSNIQRVNIASTVIAIVSGTLVLIITWMKTARQTQYTSFLEHETTLSDILLRDGSMFFLLIILVDIVGIIPTENGASSTESGLIIMLPILTILPNMLLTRFIINLRQVGSSATTSSVSRSQSHLSTLVSFRMPTMSDIIGNLGESLDFERSCDDDGAQDGNCDGTQDDGVDANVRQRDVGGASSATIGSIEVAGSSGSGGIADSAEEIQR